MNRSGPPIWADRLLQCLCSSTRLEEIQGDLHEAYQWRLQRHHPYPGVIFILEVIGSIRWSNLKPIVFMNQYLLNFRNYLKTGWRFMLKNRTYSAINVLGLSLGIAFCWMAFLYANDEMSFDKHLPDYDRLHRLVIDFTRGNDTHHIGGSSNAMTEEFLEKLPEIALASQIVSAYGLIKRGEENMEQSYLLAKKSLIDMIGLRFIEGKVGDFQAPEEVIISETLASKLDIRGKAVGQVLEINNGEQYENFIVKGVYEDIPSNTSINRDMIISYTYYEKNTPSRRLTEWFDINMNSLFKLREGVDKTALEAKIAQIQADHQDEDGSHVVLKLQPIHEIHLNPEYGQYNGIVRGGNKELIWIFLTIGALSLLISMINYSNFNISLYINRAREVALRKVIGANRQAVFAQILSESFISVSLAGVAALAVFIVLLPTFSSFVNKTYDLNSVINSQFLYGALLILLVVSMLSGFYPALILSRFSVIKSLKGEQRVKNGKWITQGFLLIQFVISTVLIAGMLTVRGQLGYLTTFDSKMDLEKVLYFDYLPGDDQQIKRFIQTMEELPEVSMSSATSGYNGTRMKGENQFDVRHLRVENNLLSLLDITFIEGRDFDSNLSTDKVNKVIVNEKFVSMAGLENAIGQTIPFEYGDLKNPQIIGVVEDYHFESAKSAIDPLVIYQRDAYPLQSAFVKLNADIIDQEKIRRLWKREFDPFPLEMTYLSEEYQKAYRSELQLTNLVSIGCLVSIILATLGLLGTIGLQVNQKLKEVSIRKVLGATVANLIVIYSRKFFLVVGVGIVLGLAISHPVLTDWLSRYPNSISFSFGIICLAVIIVMTISIITIFSRVINVARSNPVKYLKDE